MRKIKVDLMLKDTDNLLRYLPNYCFNKILKLLAIGNV